MGKMEKEAVVCVKGELKPRQSSSNFRMRDWHFKSAQKQFFRQQRF